MKYCGWKGRRPSKLAEGGDIWWHSGSIIGARLDLALIMVDVGWYLSYHLVYGRKWRIATTPFPHIALSVYPAWRISSSWRGHLPHCLEYHSHRVAVALLSVFLFMDGLSIFLAKIFVGVKQSLWVASIIPYGSSLCKVDNGKEFEICHRGFNGGPSKIWCDTSISICLKARQAFFREITDQRLKHILLKHDPLVIAAVKMVLGSRNLESKVYGRDNLHVSSRFLDSLLDNKVPKVEAKGLLIKMFREDLVEGVDEILSVVIEGKGCLRPCDVERVRSKETVKIFPFLLDLHKPGLMRHRMIVAVVVEFLKKFFELVDVNGVEWLKEFKEFAILNDFL